MKCPYTSKCPVSEMDCYFSARSNCIFYDMFYDLRQSQEKEGQRFVESQLEEIKLQIELGGI